MPPLTERTGGALTPRFTTPERLVPMRSDRITTTRICEYCAAAFDAEVYAISKGRARFCSWPCAMASRKIPVAVRFWNNVQVSDGCWEWQGAVLKSSGYGTLSVNRKKCAAHRVSYELHFGPIPEGLLVCHHCDNRRCVRPDHLFLGTHIDNMSDMTAKKRSTVGERNKHAKLTEAQVREIRIRYARGGVTQSQLAEEFGVRSNSIHYILTHRNWKHVD